MDDEITTSEKLFLRIDRFFEVFRKLFWVSVIAWIVYRIAIA